MKDESVQEIRNKLAELINFYEENNLMSLSYHKCFEKTLAMLERSQKEFDAKLFFILMFGPLKAGKSTLTNLLAREHVSPTGFGIETTLRPSIILKSRTKEYSIDIYEAVDPRDNQEELFNIVIDTLRGISDIKAAKSRIRKRQRPLTEENVRAELIESLDTEPLITVLNVPGGNLVTEKIALIDMPGLDGVKSNWEDSVIHKLILKRADFLIFVQSSMAALNMATFNFLKDAYLGSKRPPLWLVQNVIDAKYWRSEEKKKEDTVKQQQLAKNQILSLLGISEDLRSTAINLGKASDGIDDSNENLFQESRFKEFEADLKDIMNESRVRIQQENCIKGISDAIKDCKAEFQNYKIELNEIRAEYRVQIIKLERPTNIVQEMKEAIEPETIRKSVGMLVSGYINNWKDKCSGLLDKDKLKKEFLTEEKKNLQDKFNSKRDKINKHLKEEIVECTAYKLDINEEAQKVIHRLEEKYISKLNDYLCESGIKPYEETFIFESIKKPPKFEFVINGKGKGLRNVFEKFDKKIDEACDKLIGKYEEHAKDIQEEMTREVSKELEAWIRHDYIEKYLVYINEQTEQKKKEIKQKIANIESAQGFIDHLETVCDELDELIKDNLEEESKIE